MPTPETRYAKGGDVNIAYQGTGLSDRVTRKVTGIAVAIGVRVAAQAG